MDSATGPIYPRRGSTTPKRTYVRTPNDLSRDSKMTCPQERVQPVSDEEFEDMPEQISDHFDRVRAEPEDALDDDEE